MPELIDRELTQILIDISIKQFGENWLQDMLTKNGLLIAKQIISKQPTISPEVRQGRWIPYTKNRDENVTNVFQCSECEKTVRFIMAHKMCEYTFCPFCGAKMC